MDPAIEGHKASIIRTLKRYSDFAGRSGRREFWTFFVAYLIVIFALSVVERALHLGGMLSGLAGLVLLLPNLALGFRRLHDQDKTAWLLLIGLIPLLGIIVLLYFFAQPGTPGPNTYGPPDEDVTPPAPPTVA